MVLRRSSVLRRPFGRRSTSDRAQDDPVRLALRRLLPRRQPVRIAASCSPPAVHRVPRELSLPGAASFRTDRSPWAARSAPSPSFAAFLPRPADGPEDFPLGGLRCLVPRLPGSSGTETIGCGSNLRRRRPLAGSLERKMRPPNSGSPRGDWAPDRIAPIAASGDGALPLPVPPRGGRVAGVATATDRSVVARPPFSGAHPCGPHRGTEHSVFDGSSGRGGSSRSLAAPVAPSPSVRCALRSGPADFRVLLHRRVQSNPKVYCNFRILCSFLGFVPPPRLARNRVLPFRSALSDERSPVSHPGAGFQFARTLPRRLLVVEKWRTLARFRLFDSEVASVAGRGLLGVSNVKERLSRL